MEKAILDSAKTVPWEQIEERYNDLINLNWHIEPMLQLVQFIRNEGLDKRLFGYTSLDSLIVTIYDLAQWHKEALHLQFNQHTREWHFEYHPKPFEPIEMERRYAEDQGIDKFCQFIKWLNW